MYHMKTASIEYIITWKLSFLLIDKETERYNSEKSTVRSHVTFKVLISRPKEKSMSPSFDLEKKHCKVQVTLKFRHQSLKRKARVLVSKIHLLQSWPVLCRASITHFKFSALCCTNVGGKYLKSEQEKMKNVVNCSKQTNSFFLIRHFTDLFKRIGLCHLTHFSSQISKQFLSTKLKNFYSVYNFTNTISHKTQ